MERSSLPSQTRVLLIDADVRRREARGRRFREASYEVYFAANAFEGYRMARRWQPDVVLLHTGSTGATAIELARRITRDPRTRSAAIVLTSDTGVVGAFRSRDDGTARDVMLVACDDGEVLRLVGSAAGAS
jgi:CheY-like chemotaxis protein